MEGGTAATVAQGEGGDGDNGTGGAAAMVAREGSDDSREKGGEKKSSASRRSANPISDALPLPSWERPEIRSRGGVHARSGGMRPQRGARGEPGLLTRAVDKVFRFVRLAEFEILFVLFFLIAFVLFKDLVSPQP
ncbi:hypothetical protein GUJ93_ZPchr0008g13532 [Zizania palustris]|uniref:Uncharacterized protein n=1 Tax=Zizania palustris TaxID=103762 RepID=A0A8J5V266_ZIZPA|nr:hypothetical protein GUJ93_ZPchr0008g13532 [Zizania palustris]